jgi:hypothetical protein
VARLSAVGRARLDGLEHAEASISGRRFRGTGAGDGLPAAESRRSGALEGSFIWGGGERGGGGFVAWSRGAEVGEVVEGRGGGLTVAHGRRRGSSRRRSGERQHRGNRCSGIGRTFHGSDQNVDSAS